MKKIAMLFLAFIYYCNSHAQTWEPADPAKDRMQVEEYTIVLLNAMGNSYGYEIRKGAEILVRQKDNPIIPFTRGMLVKQDAFNLAQWVISQLKITGALPKSYPPSLYVELKLTREQ